MSQLWRLVSSLLCEPGADLCGKVGKGLLAMLDCFCAICLISERHAPNAFGCPAEARDGGVLAQLKSV